MIFCNSLVLSQTGYFFSGANYSIKNYRKIISIVDELKSMGVMIKSGLCGSGVRDE